LNVISEVAEKKHGWKEYQSDHKLFDGRLVLHTGAQNATLDEVLAAPVPEATDTWKPIGHGVLLQEVIESMEGFGLQVRDAAYSLAREKQRFFGLLEVAGNDKPDYCLVIGLRNSTDQSFPASVCTGSRVFVCDNLAFSAEVMINRKHTKNILRDLPACVARAIGQIGELAGRQEQRIEAYQARKLSRPEVNDFLVESVRARALPVTKLINVRDQFDNPAYPEHNQHGDSVWKLFNGYTEVLKGGILELPRRTQILHGMLDTLCGVSFGPSEVEFDRVPVELN
jgi:uncharacterized protein DUF932